MDTFNDQHMTRPRIGFIGQGWVGRHYADCFESRGFDVVRYSLEEPYRANGDLIRNCPVVFIAVPTPTGPDGFNASAVISAMSHVASGSIVVIKSTILPGTTERIHALFPDLFIMHSPEFLVEKTAAHDAAHPNRNIIGIPANTSEFRERAMRVMNLLPTAPVELICTAREAELIKYAGNCFLYIKVVFANILHDLSCGLGCDYGQVRNMLAADPRIGPSHLAVQDAGGRGAGGHCFIKDFEALIELHRTTVYDPEGLHALEAWRDKNVELLRGSGKDLELLDAVYGKSAGLTACAHR